MGRRHLNFPEDLEREIAESAEKNFRDFTSEVIARCVEYGRIMGLSHTLSLALEQVVSNQAWACEAHDRPTIGPRQTEQVAQQAHDRPMLARLTQAWQDTFPNETVVDELTLKRWLAFTSNDESVVLNAFERAKKKGSTGDRLLNYVKSVCEDKQGFRAKAAKQTPAVQPTKPSDPSGWTLRPPTQEELDEDAEAKRVLIERGLWSPEDA